MVLLTLPLDYAKLIALPLLLGVLVSFNIYFAINWRGLARDARFGDGACGRVFGLTTGTALGSLALSGHPSTPSTGELLLISLGCTPVASLVFVPALLAYLAQPQSHATSAAINTSCLC